MTFRLCFYQFSYILTPCNLFIAFFFRQKHNTNRANVQCDKGISLSRKIKRNKNFEININSTYTYTWIENKMTKYFPEYYSKTYNNYVGIGIP